MTVVVPGGLGRAVRLREGERGQRWLDGLPALVERVLRAWRCRPDGAVRHGQVAIVVPVRSDRHGPAVLKISYPSARTRHEVRALRSVDGRGAVRVYAVDEASHAVLLERAGPATLASVPSTDHAIELAGALARTLAVPAPPGVPTLAGTTDGWADQLDRQVAAAPGLVPPAVVDRARATIRLLRNDSTATLMHGDLHFGNVLRARREPWLAIDPLGWRGTAAYDAFTVAAEVPGHRDVRARIHRYAAAAGVDADLALACCQARATSSYLHQRRTGGRWFDDDLLYRLMTLDHPA